MAYYAALVPLVQVLEDIIHRDRYQDLLLDKQQIASIYEKFNLLQALLDDDYSPKDGEAADSLEGRIRDATYRAQDIIESQISNQVYRKGKTHGVERVLRRSISALLKAVLGQPQPQRCKELGLDNQEKAYQELERVKEEVDSLVEELMRIKKSHATEDLQLNYYSADAGTSNQARGTSTMEGFEERLTTIKDQLYGEPSKLQVVSIVGMGGIGKTTLARNIFDDELIVYKFDCWAWVTVSQDYHLQKVLLGILKSLNVTIDKASGVAELGEKIYKHLKERRYLIIMDDMWDTKVWDDMKWILPDDSNGSRIMITTRISNVASYADRFGIYHEMELLNEDQSWNLFREKVFCPLELEDIGRLIAKNCRGLPLAIVVVAGLLSKAKKTRRYWEMIARNISSAAAENDEHFSKILSLSYNHLPHHLKSCLLYIGGFPEDSEIPVSKLVKLWIAEGFVKPIDSKSLELVAEEYLEDLVNRNLVSIAKKRANGKIKYCGIHDVLRDLCMERVYHGNFLHVLDEDDHFHPTAAKNVRRIYVLHTRSMVTGVEECGSYVRSIIRLSHDWNFLYFGPSFKLLRVLDAVSILLFSFPAEILELFHLRYLALPHLALPIPPSISILQNLQTLILVSWDGFLQSFSLPSEIWKMPNLRHIMVCRLELSPLIDERTVCEPILENLQTLTGVTNVRFTNEMVKMIPNIRKLKVLYYETRGAWQKYCLDNLFHLCQLETLNIWFPGRDDNIVHPFPESFAFPLMLKELSLKKCRLPWTDMTKVASLPNLQVLKLRDDSFVGEKWEPVEGEFLQLKYLLLHRLRLKYWQAENTHFPSLRRLKIDTCWELQEIPLEIGEISTLELVEVNFSNLAAKSAMKMQEEQRDLGNDVLQFRVHPQYNKFWEKEASESKEEIQEDALESKEEIQEEEGLESKEEIREDKEELQEITVVN